MKRKILEILLLLYIVLSLGCLDFPGADEEELISYSFGNIENHDLGNTISANILIPPNASNEEIKSLLRYFKDVEFKDYTSIKIIVYDNETYAQTHQLDEPVLHLARLNKIESSKDIGLQEGKIGIGCMNKAPEITETTEVIKTFVLTDNDIEENLMVILLESGFTVKSIEVSGGVVYFDIYDVGMLPDYQKKQLIVTLAQLAHQERRGSGGTNVYLYDEYGVKIASARYSLYDDVRDVKLY